MNYNQLNRCFKSLKEEYYLIETYFLLFEKFTEISRLFLLLKKMHLLHFYCQFGTF